MKTINENQIITNIEESIKLLKKLSLYKINKPTKNKQLDYSKKFSSEFKEKSFSNDYKDIYDTAIENDDFDIKLVDDSFFQFSFEKTKKNFVMKLCYYPNPYDMMTYNEYIKRKITQKEDFDSLDKEYSQMKDEAPMKREIIPIRYDYNESEYKELIHPISHLHIGFYQDCRIAIDYTLNPKLFTLYIIILFYNRYWENAVKTDQNIEDYLLIKKIVKEKYENNLLNEKEKEILYIN